MAIIEYLLTFVGGGAVVWIIANNPRWIDITKSGIFWVLRKRSEKADKGFVRSNIQATVNSYGVEELGYEISDRFEIIWEKRSSKERFIEEGDVIIRLDESENQSKNIATATLEFVRRGVVADERKFLDPNISDGIDYSISLDMLTRTEARRPREILYQEIILPKMQDEDGNFVENEHKVAFDKIEISRKGGMLGPVILDSFSHLNGYGFPDEQIQKETKELVNFIERILTRDPGEAVPLSFEGDFFDLQVGIVGRNPRTVGFYKRKTKENLNKHKDVYNIGVGKESMRTVAKVLDELEGMQIVEDSDNFIFRMPDDALHYPNEKAIVTRMSTSN